jgi:integrase
LIFFEISLKVRRFFGSFSGQKQHFQRRIDIVTVSAYLGHSAPSFTADIYSHLIAEAKAKATDALADTILVK